MTITIHSEDGTLLLTGNVDEEARRVRTLDVSEAAGVVRKMFLGLPVLLAALDSALERGDLKLYETEGADGHE